MYVNIPLPCASLYCALRTALWCALGARARVHAVCMYMYVHIRMYLNSCYAFVVIAINFVHFCQEKCYDIEATKLAARLPATHLPPYFFN